MCLEVNRCVAGNLTQDGTGSRTHSYQWDGEGRLKSVNNGSLAVEVYNALGQRVDHTWPGNRMTWLYHPDGTEMSDFMPVPWNDWGNTYFNLNGRPIAKYIGGPGQEWDMETFFFHANALGSTSMMTWYNGDVVQKEIFYPYGQDWAIGGSVGSFRFASLREPLPLSDSARLIMTQSRDYPARFYRWMSPDEFTGGPVDAITGSLGGPDPTPPGPLPYADILNPQSLNKYQYAYNNPLRYNDPTGHIIDELADAAFLTYDIKELWHNPSSGTNWAAFGADVVGAAIPVVTGLGLGVRGLARAERLRENVRIGKAAEEAVEKELREEGVTILGRQATAKTEAGTRRIDFLVGDVKNPGAVEAKSSRADRTPGQRFKDETMETKGAKLVGKNVPRELRGQAVRIPTEVRRPKNPFEPD